MHVTSLKACFAVKLDGGPGLGLSQGNMGLEGRGNALAFSSSQTMELS